MRHGAGPWQGAESERAKLEGERGAASSGFLNESCCCCCALPCCYGGEEGREAPSAVAAVMAVALSRPGAGLCVSIQAGSATQRSARPRQAHLGPPPGTARLEGPRPCSALRRCGVSASAGAAGAAAASRSSPAATSGRAGATTSPSPGRGAGSRSASSSPWNKVQSPARFK